MPPIIEMQSLTKRFGRKTALDSLSLEVEPGTMLALLGPNGAGKTTALRILMDIWRPTRGEARIFGVPTRRLGRREFEKIGYVSENQSMPGWMTVRQLLDYLRPLYPSWDEAFCQQLLKAFDLPTGQRLRHLSRGMRMKAALISSLAYRPELLILDEPFSGLDPVVRHDFIEGLIEFTTQGNWTVLLASHDMDEVERLSDRIAIIDHGKLIVNEDLDALRHRYRRITAVVDEMEPAWPGSAPAQWVQPRLAPRAVEFVTTQAESADEAALRERWPTAHGIAIEPMALKDIYLAVAREARKHLPPVS